MRAPPSPDVSRQLDHFEATGRGFDEALGVFVARAAEDGSRWSARRARRDRRTAPVSDGWTARPDGAGRLPAFRRAV
jgi:hypothetical protein